MRVSYTMCIVLCVLHTCLKAGAARDKRLAISVPVVNEQCAKCWQYCNTTMPTSDLEVSVSVGGGEYSSSECGSKHQLLAGEQMSLKILSRIKDIYQARCVFKNNHLPLKSASGNLLYVIDIIGGDTHEGDWDCIFLTRNSRSFPGVGQIECSSEYNLRQTYLRTDCRFEIKVNRPAQPQEPAGEPQAPAATPGGPGLAYAIVGGLIAVVTVVIFVIWLFFRTKTDYKQAPTAYENYTYGAPPPFTIELKPEESYFTPAGQGATPSVQQIATTVDGNQRPMYSDVLKVHPRQDPTPTVTCVHYAVSDPSYLNVREGEAKKEKQEYTNVFTNGRYCNSKDRPADYAEPAYCQIQERY